MKSAAGGDPLGAYKAGCYLGGQFPGVVPLDEDRAYEYKLVAAQAGYSIAQHDVAVHLWRRGEREQAVKWWTQAADQGFEFSLRVLARAHAQGEAVALDRSLAYEFFLKSNQHGGQRMSAPDQKTFEDLRAQLTVEEIRRAEAQATQWRPQPTPLTMRAKLGLQDALNHTRAPGR